MKIMRWFLVVVMLCSLNPAVLAVETSTKKEIKYSAEAEILKALGLYQESGEIDLAKGVTRGQLAEVAVRLSGVKGDLAPIDSAVFKDVTAKEPLSGSIAMAVDLGWMEGINATTFGINEIVKGDAAIKMVVSALGYDYYAQLKGGYPTGYLVVANDLRLLKGLAISAGDDLTWDTLSGLVYNALEVELLKPMGFGSEQTYYTENNVTLLNDRLKFYKDKGIVNATHITSLIGEGTNRIGYVDIGGFLYAKGNTSADQMLGYEVEFYYYNNDAEDILAYVNKTNRNSEIIVPSEDYIGVSGKEFKYVKDNRDEETIIPGSADIIFGGRAKPKYTMAELQDNTDQVKLLDNDGDGEIEVVFAAVYVNVVINKLNATKDTIYDMTNHPPIVIDSTNTDVTVSLTSEGLPFKVSQLQKYDVLTITTDVIKTVNGRNMVDVDLAKQYDMVVCTDYIEGIVNEKDDKGIFVDGNHYRFADSYDMANNPVILGNRYTFSLDALGRIAYNQPSKASGIEYGFLINIAEKKGLDNKLMAKIFTAGGEKRLYDCSEKLFIDEIAYDTNTQKLGALKTAADADGSTTDGYRQLIKYKINSEGLINSIDTVTPNAEDETALELNYSTVVSNAQLKYKTKGTTFDGQYILKSKSLIFGIPQDSSNEDDYVILKTNFFKNDDSYSGFIYDCTDAHAIKAMAVLFKPVLSNTLCVVQKVSKAIHKDGTQVTKVKAFHNGAEKELYGKNLTGGTNAFDGVKPGDVLKITLDAFDNVETAVIISSVDSLNNFTTIISRPTFFTTGRFIIGEARYLEDDNVLIRYGAVTDDDIGRKFYDVINLTSTNVYVCDLTRSEITVKKGSADDVKTSSQGYSNPSIICAGGDWGEINTIIIYNFE